MPDVMFEPPTPRNEPELTYAPGSPEITGLRRALDELKQERLEIPLIIGGKEIRTGRIGKVVRPHDHGRILAEYHQAGPAEIEQAAAAAREAWRQWSRASWSSRLAVFLRAAELLSTRYRSRLTAAVMLNHSKTVQQAEGDVAELIDFFRFNPHNAWQLSTTQPNQSPGVWNRLEIRPLEGFIFAVTPFNFVAIGGNLPTSPAMMGNTVLWKPASPVVYSNYWVMELLKEAGLPDGVINFIPGSGSQVGGPVLENPNLAGVHFTGSTEVFQNIWGDIGQNIRRYKGYPRIVGETGGKDFIVVHASADPQATVTALLRGAFEYQGQKCSAVSRAYVPESLWPRIKEALLDLTATIKTGDIEDFSNFMGAVIDTNAFQRIESYLEAAKEDASCEILCGGKIDRNRGYFVQPTVILTEDPGHRLMKEEIFGPVLTIYVYPDQDYVKTLDLCDRTSPYALTGAVFANDRQAIDRAHELLWHAAGNFYVNDKPTGALVGQQPFGGGRASGTNDKAGSAMNLIRWINYRTVKENLNPPRDYRYPFMISEEE